MRDDDDGVDSKSNRDECFRPVIAYLIRESNLVVS
jgi:hypothetical protein